MTSTGPATHVAFEVDRAWVDEVESALAAVAGGVWDKLAPLLERWWSRGQQRLAVATAPLPAAVRAELVSALAIEPILAELIDQAPAVVRASTLERLRARAHFPGRLAALGAPEAVIAHERTRVAADVAALDPGSPWVDEPTPALSFVTAPDGEEVPDLHVWLDHMLQAVRADATLVGIGERFHATEPAGRFLADERAPHPAPPALAWPDADGTCYGVHPDPGFWLAPSIALPRRLDVPAAGLNPARLVVVGLGGGPATYAIAGDVPADELVPELAPRVAGLAPARALLSFVWLETDVTAAWG